MIRLFKTVTQESITLINLNKEQRLELSQANRKKTNTQQLRNFMKGACLSCKIPGQRLPTRREHIVIPEVPELKRDMGRVRSEFFMAGKTQEWTQKF